MKLVISLLASFVSFAGMPRCENGRLQWEEKGGYSDFVCGDSWTAPDRSVLVMTAVGNSNPNETYFLLWQSNRPTILTEVRVPALDRKAPPYERLFRYPQLAPDRRLLYFEILASVTGVSQLFSITTNEDRRVKAVTYEAEYCVIWGGKYSGKLLVTQRERGDSLDRPVVYRRRLLGLGSSPRDLGMPSDRPRSFTTGWLARVG